MERIDLNDKFLHGILASRSHDLEIDAARKVRKLDSILSNGYLYCLDTFIKKDLDDTFKPFKFDEFWNPRSTVSLSVPNTSKYHHDGDAMNENAFLEWTNTTFYLIFSNQLLFDFPIDRGFFRNEYYLEGDIPVDKYLVGIGNAGLEISYYLRFIYYFLKYYDNEISFDEFKSLNYNPTYTDEYYDDFNLENRNITSIALKIDKLEKDFISSSISKELYYEKLKSIASKYNIKLFDSTGILIDEDSINSDSSNMINYINENDYKVKKYI